MEKIKTKLVTMGVPLMTHNEQLANPFNPYAQLLKELTQKRKKTDSDFMEIARVEWEGGLYLHKGIVVLPARVIDATIFEGAKLLKLGKKYKIAAIVAEEQFELHYKGPKIEIKNNSDGIPIEELDKFFEYHKDQRMVGRGPARVLRTRPIFYDWWVEPSFLLDEKQMDKRELKSILEVGRSRVGFCELRPRLGRFELEEMS